MTDGVRGLEAPKTSLDLTARLMLTALRDLSVIVGLSLWLLGFLIAWWQGSKGECPEGTGKEGMHF